MSVMVVKGLAIHNFLLLHADSTLSVWSEACGESEEVGFLGDRVVQFYHLAHLVIFIMIPFPKWKQCKYRIFLNKKNIIDLENRNYLDRKFIEQFVG